MNIIDRMTIDVEAKGLVYCPVAKCPTAIEKRRNIWPDGLGGSYNVCTKQSCQLIGCDLNNSPRQLTTE